MSDHNQTPQQPAQAQAQAPHQADPTDADLRNEAPPPGWAAGAWKRFRTTDIENQNLRRQVAELQPVKAEAEQWKQRHAQDAQAWGFERAYYQNGFSDPEGLEVARAIWNAKPPEQRGDPAQFLATPPKALQPYKGNTSPAQQAQPQQAPAAPQQAPAAQAQAAPPPPNPNGGAAQPAGAPGTNRYTNEDLKRITAQNGGRLPPHVLAELAQDPTLKVKGIPTKKAQG